MRNIIEARRGLSQTIKIEWVRQLGSILFDFLTESVLFSPQGLAEDYASLPEAELSLALQDDREFCVTHQQELAAEAMSKRGSFTLFTGLHPVPLDVLKQSALYVERYVIADPLFPLTEPEHAVGRAMRSYLGVCKERLDRAAISKAATGLRALTAMIAADYVKCLPVSFLFEVPEHVPIYFSENRFSDALRSDVLSFFHAQATVEPLRRDGAEWVTDPNASVAREIAVGFGDEPGEMLYQLFEQKIEFLDEATGTYTANITLPDTPPAPDYYAAWVDQSVNRTAINLLRRLSTELALSVELGASYVCFSQFRCDLLSKFFPVTVETAQHTANIMLALDLPFATEIDTDSLMTLRREEGETFQIFRRELERQLWDLRHEQDRERLRSKVQKVMHELGSVQSGLLSQKLKQFRRNAVIQYATLGATLLASHQYLPGLIAAAGLSLKLKADYDAALRQNPAYFLWKADEGPLGQTSSAHIELQSAFLRKRTS